MPSRRIRHSIRSRRGDTVRVAFPVSPCHAQSLLVKRPSRRKRQRLRIVSMRSPRCFSYPSIKQKTCPPYLVYPCGSPPVQRGESKRQVIDGFYNKTIRRCVRVACGWRFARRELAVPVSSLSLAAAAENGVKKSSPACICPGLAEDPPLEGPESLQCPRWVH